jgi:mono/diheme cytochrome c family protein
VIKITAVASAGSRELHQVQRKLLSFFTGIRRLASGQFHHSCTNEGLSASSGKSNNKHGDKAIMKMTKLVVLVVTIAVALFILVPGLSWAADGAGIYKAKCAACHGADGAGKPAAKIPSLVSDEAKKLSDADLTDMVANGGPSKKPMHAFASKGLSADDVKAVVSAVRDLQKK